jgi:hypothetical protein
MQMIQPVLISLLTQIAAQNSLPMLDLQPVFSSKPEPWKAHFKSAATGANLAINGLLKRSQSIYWQIEN